jgi:hypothetical protein
MLYLILFNLSVLLTLTILHLFWLFGGKTGLKYAFPHNSKHRKKIYKPPFLVLFILTLLLGGMTMMCFAQLDVIDNLIDQKIVMWGNIISAILLMTRGVGNFKYLGLTKSFTGTDFSKLDTYLYSPLCLLMACINLVITFVL